MNESVVFASIILAIPALAIPVGWMIGILVRKERQLNARLKWRKESTVVAEYEAPDKLRPAEIAFLYDRSFGKPELLATLFDLELRKKVVLSAIRTPHNKADFSIEVMGETTDKALAPFEQEVLLSVKAHHKMPRWSVLAMNTRVWDSEIEQILEQDLRQRGYFWHQSTAKRLRWRFMVIGGLLALATFVAPIALSERWFSTTAPVIIDPYQTLSQQLGMIFIGMCWLIIAAIYAVCVAYGYGAYERAMDIERGTERLRLLWPRLDGFQTYLSVVEQDRIIFDNEQRAHHAKLHSMPYAIALNLRTNWQARFHI